MVETKKADWNKRIGRAMDLAAQHPSAQEILAFYCRILEFQRALYGELSPGAVPALNRAAALREQLDVESALRQLPALLTLVQQCGPSKMAEQAAEVSRAALESQRLMLRDFLAADGDDNAASSFFARVLFQPQAEFLAAVPATELAGFAGSQCPICGTKPQVAVLRPEGEGGKRFLVCSFCLTEWEFRRILCPVCGEEDHAKLPRYAAEGVAAVRVEACDTCKHYLKSVDMTVDGLAVPMADEIATAALDLWAAEHGYTKISRNLMGF